MNNYIVSQRMSGEGQVVVSARRVGADDAYGGHLYRDEPRAFDAAEQYCEFAGLDPSDVLFALDETEEESTS